MGRDQKFKPSAVDVYPPANLVVHGSAGSVIKARSNEARREVLAALRTKLTIGGSVTDLPTSADLVNAVCVLAGDDFIAGRAKSPEDRSLAEREGWIWTAAPKL